MATWTGRNYWGYGAQPHTVDEDPEQWQDFVREQTRQNYWPQYSVTNYRPQDERKDSQRREASKDYFADTGNMLPPSKFGDTGSRTVGQDTRIRQPDQRGMVGFGIQNEKYQAMQDRFSNKVFEVGVGKPENLGEPASAQEVSGWMRDSETGVYTGVKPDGGMYMSKEKPRIGGGVPPKSQDEVSGWIRDEATGMYTGVRSDNSIYKSTIKPTVSGYRSQGMGPQGQQSQASMLKQYNKSVTDSIHGYYNQLRTESDREFERTKYRAFRGQPSYKDLGMSRDEYEGGMRAGRTGPGGQAHPIYDSEAFRSYQAQTDAMGRQWKEGKRDTIDQIESARQKALFSAEKQAMSRGYSLEKALFTKRNKPTTPFAEHSAIKKSLSVAESHAEFSGFVRPKGNWWRGRVAEADAYKAGTSSEPLVVDETSIPTGTSPQYIAMTRAAVDLMNEYNSTDRDYQRLSDLSQRYEGEYMQWERANVREEQEQLEERDTQRRRGYDERDEDEYGGMPSDAGNYIFDY